MADNLFKDESYKIIGACFEVHKILGHGFKEAVYKDALELEFIRLQIPFVKEKPYTIMYKQQKLKHFLWQILLFMMLLSLRSRLEIILVNPS